MHWKHEKYHGKVEHHETHLGDVGDPGGLLLLGGGHQVDDGLRPTLDTLYVEFEIQAAC